MQKVQRLLDDIRPVSSTNIRLASRNTIRTGRGNSTQKCREIAHGLCAEDLRWTPRSAVRLIPSQFIALQKVLTYRRKFWRHMLPRLKYHNPRIPMTVSRTNNQTGPATLSIYLTRTDAPTQKELLDQETPSAAATIDPPQTPDEPINPSESLPDSFQPIRHLESADSDHFKTKIPGPGPTQRVVDVQMKHKSEDEILADMLSVTGGQAVQPTQGELDTLKELEEFRERSKKDSVRSKEVRAKWKREQEMLRLAKGEAV